MAELELIGVKNRFVQRTDLHVPDGGTFAIVGPSGAGKTSLLRIIAGLEPHEGRILIDRSEVQSVPANRRAVGMVSQDLHLFPHLTVEGNLFLAMSRSDCSRTVRRRRVSDLMELLRITHLAGRKPATFSGGEKQRTALARVLASAPRLLLLDEPFSKLDFRTARYLRAEFKNLQAQLGLTSIIVTHDIEEAADLARTVSVMRSGLLTVSECRTGQDSQAGNPVELFLETPNLLTCRPIRNLGNGLVEAEWAGGILHIPDEGQPFSSFTVKRRGVEIGPAPPAGPRINRFTGLIRQVKINDDSAMILLDVNSAILRVETTPEDWTRMGLSEGNTVHGLMKLRALEACCPIISSRDNPK